VRTDQATAGVLVAGIGNVFLADDGFGPEVVRYLASPGEPSLPADARLVDYGIRGLHLAYDLLEGFDALLIIDALPAHGAPGEVVVLQVSEDDLGRLGADFDPHGMNPVAVLSGLPALGGELPPTFVIGAAPSDLEDGIGLTASMAAAVPRAAAAVRELLLARPWAIRQPAAATSGLQG